ncbi:SAM-dependent methyltransferase [Roseinatronobacter alkalisoli]|uniref:Cyclopropane-fatty-acyl-phospholipid synthase n=1 Tax=Roseinatronobacter alkalisoli TaxID=3028235 RepID=A0ABT5T7J9_9RHOB|nr:cyclopropane-fatty-acyl-phospholipid synthase family protein [Roseinatronobacter sp. HJB301]MDD7970924.1 cyclopropane-fatty-acyl-phospholipid synthase [Roseinatronobacter sp. HJB301]
MPKVMRKFARKRFEALITAIFRSGTLIVDGPDGQRYRMGDQTGTKVHIRIATWDRVFRLVLNPDLALGEGFMDGDVQMIKGSIYDLLAVIFQNLGSDDPPGMSRVTRSVFRLVLRFTSYNSVGKSKRNVAHHYDLDGRLYELFLDSDQQYSCAYFETPETTLEDAQMAKKRHLVAKLHVQPGHSVLDIGSGWGGLGIYLARYAKARVKGVTLSEEQLAVSRARAEDEGLQGRLNFELRDYRLLDERFDRIVSVGMFEHVGRKSYHEFFSKVRSLLADDGVAVLHYIGRTTPPTETNAWILKYIFPGGHMPSLSEVLPEIERQGLVVTDIEVLRLHYAETLRHWRERFMARREQAVALYDERFARMWEFYLAASESAFRYQGLVVHQIQMVRDQNVLPLARNYIQTAEDAYRQRETELHDDAMAKAAE